MKIQTLHLDSNPLFGSKKIEFRDAGGNILNLIVFAGNNGSGKTTMLESIFEILTQHTEKQNKKEKPVKGRREMLNIQKMSEPEYLQEYIRIQKPKNWDDFTPQIKQKIKETILSLSEENRCTFIMAGFWELYYAASYDYQSPIKNFAETLFIAALEPDVCRKLAVIPMQLLNYAYESDTIVDLMIEETGRRANLIAITCDALLQKADMQKRVITKDDLDEILDSNAIRASLAGWEQIKLDRVVVYAAIHMDRFTISDVIDRLSHTSSKYEVEDLKQSLMRLELSFILVRKHQYYRYCVPVFKKIILESDPERMLEGEVME